MKKLLIALMIACCLAVGVGQSQAEDQCSDIGDYIQYLGMVLSDTQAALDAGWALLDYWSETGIVAVGSERWNNEMDMQYDLMSDEQDIVDTIDFEVAYAKVLECPM